MPGEKYTGYDFKGWATRANVKCSDGRTIRPNAFSHQDGVQVPLVWHHMHREPGNVLGHAILEKRPEGVYAYGWFNKTEAAQTSKELLEHGDIRSLSIFANNVSEKDSIVHDGNIVEVSLVLVGANPGATIEQVVFAHGDGSEYEAEGEVVINLDLGFEKDETQVAKDIAHAATGDGEETLEDVLNTLNEKQMTAVSAVIASAIELQVGDSSTVEQSGITDEENTNSEGEESIMPTNVFEMNGAQPGAPKTLTHEQFMEVVEDAKRTYNGSFMQSLMAHAVTYGIENISYLFPDARTLQTAPTWIRRDMTWVRGWMNSTRHVPFSNIKSMAADLTLDTARAKGYVKASLKKEQFFEITRRVTTPTTIYKKQKLDRDDTIDITDLNVIAMLHEEMRFMTEEEIARAGLVGDGRDVADADKVSETNIRPIYKDDDFYVHRVLLNAADEPTDFVDAIIRSRKSYKGTGRPNMYCTTDFLTDMLLMKDTTGRYIYDNVDQLAAKLRVAEIVEVPVMEGVERDVTDPAPATYVLRAILVNPSDYTYGANKGGELTNFETFDLNYNQFTYLTEARTSACLTLPKSAVVVEQKAA